VDNVQSARSYEVLQPPASDFFKTPNAMSSLVLITSSVSAAQLASLRNAGPDIGKTPEQQASS